MAFRLPVRLLIEFSIFIAWPGHIAYIPLPNACSRVKMPLDGQRICVLTLQWTQYGRDLRRLLIQAALQVEVGIEGIDWPGRGWAMQQFRAMCPGQRSTEPHTGRQGRLCIYIYIYMSLPTGNRWQGAPILIFSNAALNLANKSSPGSFFGSQKASHCQGHRSGDTLYRTPNSSYTNFSLCALHQTSGAFLFTSSQQRT